MESQIAKTITGIKWSFYNQLVTQGALFIVGIYLMNLLPPEEFGILGMVTFFTGALAVFSDFGLNSSLIQKKKITKEDKNTVYWLSVLLSALLSLLLFAGSFFIADFYAEPRLTLLAQVLSLNFILQGLGSMHQVLFKKALNFKMLFIMRSCAIAISATVAMVLAYNNYGVWALVYQTLTNSLVFSILGFLLSDFRPNWSFDKGVVREHLGFGLPVFGTRMTDYGANNADKLLIGKLIDAYSLGIYSRAFTLITLPLHHLSQVLTTVMFSSFSLIQEDPVRIDKQQRLLTKMLLYAVSPVVGLIIVYAEAILVSLAGEKWIPSAPIMQILGIGVFFKIMVTLRSNVLWSLGHSKYELYYTIISSVVALVAQIIGVQFGIIGVALGYSFAMVITIFPAYFYTAKALKSSLFEQLQNIFLPLLIFLFPTSLVFFFFADFKLWIGVLTFLTIYSGTLMLLEGKIVKIGYNLISKRIK